MKHKAIVLFLAMILQVGASVGAFANNLPYAVDFAPIRFADSLVVASDTVPADSLSSKTAKKEAIDAPVYYESTDSMVWSRGGNAFLYGSGKVTYDNVELTADVITMNMDSSVVHAVGRVDSLGEMVGLPVFKDGNTPYESDRMSYNFKTKKGFIC